MLRGLEVVQMNDIPLNDIPQALNRKRPSPPSTAQPLRPASSQIVFGFWEKIADGRVAITGRTKVPNER
jgi:hypothetical protein